MLFTFIMIFDQIFDFKKQVFKISFQLLAAFREMRLDLDF